MNDAQVARRHTLGLGPPALAFAVLLGSLQVARSDLPLKVAVFSAAVAVPLGLASWIFDTEPRSEVTSTGFRLGMSGIVLNIVAVAALVWHLWWPASIGFVVSVV